MSKRSVLNTTSRKKRNGMQTWSNTLPTTGASRATAPGNYIITGTTGGRSLWVATAMDLTDGTGVIGRVAETAVRTSTSCYMVGLSEHIRIQTSTGLPWFWRRICFTYKADAFLITQASDTVVNPYPPSLDTSGGMQRIFFNQYTNNMQATIDAQDAIIFKGSKNVDWTDTIIAPLDTSRITVKFDKTTVLRSGNAFGTVKESKLFHPMRKNIVYADDESGDTENTQYYSVASKAGMGDYYVMDIFSPGSAGTSTDTLLLQANSTLYWHEK